MRRYAASDYTIQTGRDRVTGEYVAIVSEFPSLSWVGVDRRIAADGMRRLLVDVLDDMYESGEEVPGPGEPRLNSIFVAGEDLVPR